MRNVSERVYKEEMKGGVKMKRIIYPIIIMLIVFILSVMATEGVNRAKRKVLDTHSNRFENIKEWRGPTILKEKSNLIRPEIEGSKHEISEGVRKEGIRVIRGIVKRKNKTTNLQMVQLYNPAFELERIKRLKKLSVSLISAKQNKIKILHNGNLKRESRKQIEYLKENFYLDFLEMKLENAKIAGKEEIIEEIESAVQKYSIFLNSKEKSR
ncbi:hypothetical protein KAU34_05080 [candidate division WOR-3 bacterium]|nr:hypothetical protein [candidate division WOR-3 bacterium]